MPERIDAAGKGVKVSRTLSRLGFGSVCVVLCPEEDRGFSGSDLARLSESG